jgi:hypothetical protein
MILPGNTAMPSCDCGVILLLLTLLNIFVMRRSSLSLMDVL